MTNNRINGKLKILYIIFSVAVAIALWTYVAYIGNPMLDEPMAVPNVPVEFEGEELLRDNDLIVSNIDVKELTVYFSGRLRDTAAISNMQVRAVVDLTDILLYPSPTGTHALDYELLYDNSGSTLTVDKVSRPVIEVTVERLVTETIPIEPVYNGSIAENYMAGELTLSRNTVDVAGTEAAIGKIHKATVTLARDNLSETATQTQPIRLFDETGGEINMDEEGLSFVNSDGTAIITQNILMVKEVPLTIDIVESATATDANTQVKIEPEYVTLSGDPEYLEDLNVLNIGTVDLKTIYLTYEDTYQIKIPNNTRSMSGETVAKVSINVSDSSIQLRRLSASNISYRNAADTDYVTVITQSLDIVLRGKADKLDDVDPANIRIIADLTNFAGQKGTTTAPARVFVDGFTDVEAVGGYSITVTISDTPPQPRDIGNSAGVTS